VHDFPEKLVYSWLTFEREVFTVPLCPFSHDLYRWAAWLSSLTLKSACLGREELCLMQLQKVQGVS
jgi:hypothetical protein